MLTPPPGLFERPLLGDVWRALGLLLAACAVFVLPQVLLPVRLWWWWFASVCGLLLWFTAFLMVRMWQMQRRGKAEDAARRAPWDTPAP